MCLNPQFMLINIVLELARWMPFSISLDQNFVSGSIVSFDKS
jgi:hypothetical protein